MDLAVLRWLQGFSSPGLDRAFIYITNLGSEVFYIFAICVIYWCVSKKHGYRLAVLVLMSYKLNLNLKEFFRRPRPFGPEVRVLYPESAASWSFPSGHTQQAAAFWGYNARINDRKWFTVFSVSIALLIATSRVYLGVHYPSDVVAGLLVGFAFAYSFVAVDRWINQVELSLGPRLLGSGVVLAVLLALPGHDYAVEIAGVVFGAMVGYFLEQEYVNLEIKASWWQYLLRVVIGFASLWSVEVALAQFLPATFWWTVLHYAGIGLWVFFFVPLVFKIFHLYRSPRRRGYYRW